MSARAYQVWRIDCDCGEVYDCDGADEPDERCAECGDRVERSDG